MESVDAGSCGLATAPGVASARERVEMSVGFYDGGALPIGRQAKLVRSHENGAEVVEGLDFGGGEGAIVDADVVDWHSQLH